MKNDLEKVQYDVVIIGAGVQGLSTAFFLSVNKKNKVAVIETEPTFGKGSSSRSGSMIMKSRENKPKIELSLFSFKFFENYYQFFNEPFIFRKTGFLSAVSSEMAERYEREHILRCELGVPSKMLSTLEIKQLCPGIITSDLEFGLFCPDDGEVEASQILSCYEQYARINGVDFYFNETVRDFDITNGKLTGVATDHYHLQCAYVVNSAGPNAPKVAKLLDIDLPQDNRSRSIFYCNVKKPSLFQGPMVEDAKIEWYYRGLTDNRVLIGMGYESSFEVSNEPNYDFLPSIREATLKRAPALADFKVEDGHSGIRPMSPDIMPIIGVTSAHNNFILNTGWGGEGIMHSPAGGAIVSDIIDGSKNYPFDISEFKPGRFEVMNVQQKRT